MHRHLLVVLAFCGAPAFAGPGDLPRFPDTGSEADAFRDEAAARYRAILARLSSAGKLDDDRVMLDRVRHVAAGLIVAAKDARPSSGAWAWEVHVTSDPSVSAFCIAGGKILVGGDLVKRLELSDAELAMLLGHEIAHAVAGHRREASRGGMETDPAQEVRQARSAVMQEDEADEIGMKLAYRAGWPLPGLVGFYEKLAAQEPAGTFNSSHSPAASRVEAARLLAAKLSREGR